MFSRNKKIGVGILFSGIAEFKTKNNARNNEQSKMEKNKNNKIRGYYYHEYICT